MKKTVQPTRRRFAGIPAAVILGICLLMTVGILTVSAADTHPPRLVDNAELLSQADADSCAPCWTSTARNCRWTLWS